MKSIVLSMVVLAVVGACDREIGRTFDLSRADALVPGKSTVAEAVGLLGPPIRTKKYLGNETVVRWHYLKDRPGGGTDSMTLEVRFGADDRMLSILRRDDYRSAAARAPAS